MTSIFQKCFNNTPSSQLLGSVWVFCSFYNGMNLKLFQLTSPLSHLNFGVSLADSPLQHPTINKIDLLTHACKAKEQTIQTLDLATSTAAVTEDMALPSNDEAEFESIHPPVHPPHPDPAEGSSTSLVASASEGFLEGSDSTLGES